MTEHVAPHVIYREMMTSTTKMLAAEARFNELRDHYRTHPRYTHLGRTDQDARNAADPRTKEAITQCTFHRDRANTLANVYNAWTTQQTRTETWFKNSTNTD